MSQLMKISVKKGGQGYGFIISNQAPCIVSNITEGGPADIASLRTGDEILEVNNQNVSRSTHEQVVRLILKCTGPWISLKIRRYSHPVDMIDDLIDVHDEKEDLHQSIIETIDKVVEDLKLGSIFKESEDPHKKKSQLQKRRSRPLHEKLFEDHVPRLPIDHGATEKNVTTKKAASPKNLNTFKDIQLDRSPLSDSFQSNDSNISTPDSTLRAVVGYLRTVELPDSRNLPIASQNVLNNCIKALHVTSKKVNKYFLMSLSKNGIHLSDSNGKTVVTYPLRLITYTCSCPEDDKFFGIVTKKDLIVENFPPSPYEPKRNYRGQPNDVCACHIFMIDDELVSHLQHKSLAKMFGISCNQPVEGGSCKEFPHNSFFILENINILFEEASMDSSFCCESPIEMSPVLVRKENDDLRDGLNMFKMLALKDDSMQNIVPCRENDIEVHNFTRSPIRRRNISQKDTDDIIGKDRESFDSPLGSESVKSLEKDQILMPYFRVSPSIDDPLDGSKDSQQNMRPQNGNGDCVGNEKKKDGEQSLEMLLKNPAGLQCFEDFLKKEHSEENIMFWKAIENFRTIEDPGRLRKNAIEIYHTYLAGGAPGLVNVDQKSVKKAEEKLINPDPGMFDLQQQQIFMLMKYDCFPRFLKSEFYRRIPMTSDLLTTSETEDDIENKDTRKRKSQWYLKIKSSSKDSGVKCKSDNEATEQTEKKKTLLSLWSKGKGPKQDGKSRDKTAKLGKIRARHDSQSSLSDSGSKPTTPNFTDDRKKFELPKSPSEIKELLGSESPFCRVILPNGSSNVVVLEQGKVIKHILHTCCSRQNLQLSAHDIFVGVDRKSVDLDKDSMLFAGEIFYLERKIQFRFDLPNKRSVAVRDSPSKTLYDVVEPIMRKNGYDIEKFYIHLSNNSVQLSLQTGIAAIENKHLVTEEKSKAQGNVSWKPPSGSVADLKASFKWTRQTSKDDSSLNLKSAVEAKPVKSHEDLNKFSRRGSLEGHRSYFTRLKQGIKSNKTSRSKSIDHTNFALKVIKSKSQDESDRKTLRPDSSLHKRQHSVPLFDKPYDATETNGSASLDDILLAENHAGSIADFSSETFRPSSEVFFGPDEEEPFYDRRASVPVAKNLSPRDSMNLKGNSNIDISAASVQKYPRSKFLKNLHASLNAAISDPELAVRRGRTKNVKALKPDVGRHESDASGQSYSSVTNISKLTKQRPRSDAEIGQGRRLSKNLMSWRARENSCDSASSSATDETDGAKSRKTKREDAKRFSSPEPVVLKNYPQSPRNKQKRLELSDAEVAIANSPIYLLEGNRTSVTKERPQPICMADESEILRGLDLEESYENISSPSSKVENNMLDDSFEGALEIINRKQISNDQKTNALSMTKNEDLKGQVASSDSLRSDGGKGAVELPGNKSSPQPPDRSESPSCLDFELNVTVTGSVNDETLIMEDKDTGLDFSGLMDMTNLKRNRKGGKQKAEKEPKIKETAITFV